MNNKATFCPSCEFCAELHSTPCSTFSRLYEGSPASRVIYADDTFAVVPALGQLLPNWLLVLPKVHVEKMAQLTVEELIQLEELTGRLSALLQPGGYPVVFEHGASSEKGSGCGIYHAHFHVVPLPIPIHSQLLCREFRAVPTRLSETLAGLEKSLDYLLYLDSEGVLSTAVEPELSSPVPSQLFRRQVAEHLNLTKSWDWRSYGREPELLRVLEHARLA